MFRSFAMRTVGVAALLGVTAVGPVVAQVAPKKPSDLLVLTTFFSDPCNGSTPADGEVVNSQIMPDGSIEPFSIPAGKAFMVTGVDYAINSLPTGFNTGTVLRTVDFGIVLAEGYTANTGPSGPMAGIIQLASPIRVTSNLCVSAGLNVQFHPSRIRVRGFLTPDS